MKHRLASSVLGMNNHDAQRTSGRWQFVEALVRTCQLILLMWLAVFGAQFVAKGIVQASTLLGDLLH